MKAIMNCTMAVLVSLTWSLGAQAAPRCELFGPAGVRTQFQAELAYQLKTTTAATDSYIKQLVRSAGKPELIDVTNGQEGIELTYDVKTSGGTYSITCLSYATSGKSFCECGSPIFE